VYQPIVELRGGRVVAVEALLRHRNSDGGLDGPATALDDAARAGMTLDLDRWVLERACREMAAWRDELGEDAPTAMHVNLAADSLSHPDLVPALLEAIDASGLPRGCVRLELSERAGVTDLTRALGALQELAAAGVRIALDDLGASLDTLRVLDRLPIETIKLDRSLVVGAGAREPIDTEVLSLVVRLSRRFGLEIVGEGVEEPLDEMTLRLAGVGLAQGFRYSHPLPADEAIATLRASAGRPPADPPPAAGGVVPQARPEPRPAVALGK
jgi:EAL domain-containing protein (putative c-di-GMP-specific phosphodiesterase class I)